MAYDLSRRVYDSELMDDPAVDRGELLRSLAYIRLVNRFLNGTHASLYHLARLLHHVPRDREAVIIDVGTGSGDIPVAMRRWARRKQRRLRIVAIDLHATTLSDASRLTRDSHVDLLRADAMKLPLGDRSADIVHCSMFMHHFREEAIVHMLREFDRIARIGLIVNDLLRARMALFAITLLTLGRSEIIRHDARLSVRRALRRAEAESLARSADLNYLRFHRHFGYRFCLAGARHV